MTYRHQQYYTTRPPLKARLWTAARYGLYFVAAGLLIAALAGCMKRTEDAEGKPIGELYDPIAYSDRATGCQYLSTGQAKALTPRIAADGSSHMGCKGARP